MRVVIYQVKNGPSVATYKKTVDLSKPTVQVIGHFYQFNWDIERIS